MSNKKYVLTALLVIFMLSLPMSFACGTQPTEEAGYQVVDIFSLTSEDVKLPTGNSPVTIESLSIAMDWYGVIDGVSQYTGIWTWHKEGLTTHGIYEFDEATVTVEGITASGGLVIKSESNPQHSGGLWVIVEATGDLQGLHGHGSLERRPPTSPLDFTYDYVASLHFD